MTKILDDLAKTLQQEADGILYVPCPRCHGSRYVSAITRPGNGFSPTVYGSFPCECCHMTAEADIERAIEYLIDRAESAAWNGEIDDDIDEFVRRHRSVTS